MGLTPPPADDFNHDRPADSAGRFVGADDDIIPLAGDDKETDAPLARPNDPSPPSVGATPASSASVSRLPTRDAGVAPTRKSRRSIRLRALRRLTPILLLLLLTLIGGVMRFTALDKPIIWGDEALTFGRTGGTYEQLLNQLADDSFTPLHYEMIWWLGQGLPYWGEIKTETGERMIRQQDGTRRLEQVTLRRFEPTHRLIPEGVVLTPAMLRLWPAIAGTLMIPAIYFLARQMFGPRIALTAALLVCFNAYLLNHSRDAKMYMPFWLMLTLNVACLMWWLRVRTTRAWLCWVGCGIAMMALHALGAFALLINVVAALTSSRQHWLGLWRLIKFLGWIVALPVVLLLAMLRKRYERVKSVPLRPYLRWPINTYRTFHWPTALLFGIGLFIIIKAPLAYFSEFNERAERVISENGMISMTQNGTGWVQSYNTGRQLFDLSLYTASAYLTGWEWPRYFPNTRINDQALIPPATLKIKKAGFVALVILLAIGLVPWRPAFSRRDRRLEQMTQERLVSAPVIRRRAIWLAVWLVVPAYVMYCQSFRVPAFVLDGVADIALKEPPAVNWPRLTRPPANIDAWTYYTSGTWVDQSSQAVARGWYAIVNVFGGSANDIALAVDPGTVAPITTPVLSRWISRYPSAWESYTAAFTGDNLAMSRLIIAAAALMLLIVLLVMRWRVLWRSSLRGAAAIAITVVLCGVLSVVPQFSDSSVWMPRYVATVLPALLLIAAVLIDRQPARWLRVLTLLVFAAVNLSQFGTRVFGYSEPPSDRIARDILDAQPQSQFLPNQPAAPTFRTYLSISGRFAGAAPGAGSYPTTPTAYYLRISSGVESHPQEIRTMAYFSRFQRWDRNSPQSIAADLKRSPQIRQFVVWTALPAGTVDETDLLAESLAGKFKRTREELFPARDHWTWINRFTARRREYVRVEE